MFKKRRLKSIMTSYASFPLFKHDKYIIFYNRNGSVITTRSVFKLK